MTDAEYLALRAFIRKHGFKTIVLELRRIAAGYARTSDKWYNITRQLQTVLLWEGKPDYDAADPDTDANESGSPLRTREEVQPTVRGVPFL